MDVSVSYLMLFVLALFFSFSLIIFAPSILYTTRRKNLPPGKMGWPVIGETLEFFSLGRKGTPEKFFNDRMTKHSSEIFKTSLIGENMVIPCGASGHKFVFTNDNKLFTSWWPRAFNKIAPSIAASSSMDDGVIRFRKMVAGFLAPRALKNYIGVMDAVAKNHLETHWKGKNEVAVFPLAKSYTFALACQTFFSIEDPVQIKKLMEPFPVLVEGLVSLPIDLPGTILNRAIKASKILTNLLLQIISKRKAESSSQAKNDILFHMLTTPDTNGRFMTEMEITYSIIGLLVASYDTASTAITFTMKYMAELPHVYEAVLKEQTKIAMDMQGGQQLTWEDLHKMNYTWNAVKETMRIIPPVQGGFSEALTDFNYAGFSIPKGYKLHWNVNTTHKNPQYFPEPDQFDPSRFEGNELVPYSYTPFGAGSRICPGMEFARLEILIFLHHVVTTFKWKKLRSDEKIIFTQNPKLEHGFPVCLSSP